MIGERRPVGVALALCALAFALDLMLPLGVAAGIPYAAIALLGAFTLPRRGAWILAGGATGLIFVGAVLSQQSAVLWVAAANRLMAIACIGCVTLLGTALARSRAARDEAHGHMATLLIAMCAQCKRVRAPSDRWEDLEAYVKDCFGAEFSHSVCRTCMRELYPELADEVERGLGR